MPLNSAALAAAIRDAFLASKAVKEVKPGDPPVEETLAADLAGAIDAFVRGGDVTGVQVSGEFGATTTTVNGHSHSVSSTVTGTQTNSVKLA